MMATNNATTIRLDEYTLKVIDTAAKYAQTSRNSFIAAAALEKAERLAKERVETLSRIAPLVLDEAESERFFQILERDFAPTEAMLELDKKRHRDIVELV